MCARASYPNTGTGRFFLIDAGGPRKGTYHQRNPPDRKEITHSLSQFLLRSRKHSRTQLVFGWKNLSRYSRTRIPRTMHVNGVRVCTLLDRWRRAAVSLAAWTGVNLTWDLRQCSSGHGLTRAARGSRSSSLLRAPRRSFPSLQSSPSTFLPTPCFARDAFPLSFYRPTNEFRLLSFSPGERVSPLHVANTFRRTLACDARSRGILGAPVFTAHFGPPPSLFYLFFFSRDNGQILISKKPMSWLSCFIYVEWDLYFE